MSIKIGIMLDHGRDKNVKGAELIKGEPKWASYLRSPLVEKILQTFNYFIIILC